MAALTEAEIARALHDVDAHLEAAAAHLLEVESCARAGTVAWSRASDGLSALVTAHRLIETVRLRLKKGARDA